MTRPGRPGSRAAGPRPLTGRRPSLHADARLSHVGDLVARTLAGPEHGAVEDADATFHRREYERLVAALEAASRASRLPEAPTARPALNDLLVRIRTARGGERPT